MNTNGLIDFSGTDRITETINTFAINSYNVPVRRTQTYVWAQNSMNTSNMISAVENSVDGLQTWNMLYNNGVPVTTHSQTAYDPANGYTIFTMTAPDDSSSITINQFGRPVSVTQYDSTGVPIGGTTYGYDAQGTAEHGD